MEYGERYDNYAAFLNQNNILVYTYDERGHGKTAGKVENLGFVADKNGWQLLSQDMGQLLDIAKTDAPDTPVFFLGQSYGSFLVRNYIIDHSHSIDGAILSATAGSAGLLSYIGMAITSVMMIFKKKNHLSPFLHNMTFGNYNNEFKPGRTKYDWLSRDESIVDKYINDPFCGTVFSIKFYKDLATGLEKINKKKYAEKVRKDLPVLLISGAKDPLSKNGKQIPKVKDLYQKAGLEDVEMKLYPDARHEIFNEINKEEVYEDVLKWIEKRLN
jgi:alpha-beta hydrolase superfamily lysophospholipase